MWQPISSAPLNRDIELAVIDETGVHILIFPCQQVLCGWINAKLGTRVDIRPTHWRDLQNESSEK